jgi:hypothetical protein
MIVAHAGHRIDKTDQSHARFPKNRVGSVYRRSYLYLLERRPRAFVSAAANGADLIVLRAAEDLFIPFHVVLPIAIDMFRHKSVDDRGPEWGEAFDRAIDRAESIITASDLAEFDDWYLRGNDFILDTASSMADQCRNGTNEGTAKTAGEGTDGQYRVEALAVLTSDPTQVGATGDFVTKAAGRNWPVHTIDPLAD